MFSWCLRVLTLLPTSHKSPQSHKASVVLLPHPMDSPTGFGPRQTSQGASLTVSIYRSDMVTPSLSECQPRKLNPLPLSRINRLCAFNMDLNTLALRTCFFSVSANADHCLQITLGSAPLGGSRFWLPLFVSTPVSTGYAAAQHANMWHFACFTDFDALFLLLVFCKCPQIPTLHWLYLLFICNQHSVLFCNHWSALKTALQWAGSQWQPGQHYPARLTVSKVIWHSHSLTSLCTWLSLGECIHIKPERTYWSAILSANWFAARPGCDHNETVLLWSSEGFLSSVHGDKL